MTIPAKLLPLFLAVLFLQGCTLGTESLPSGSRFATSIEGRYLQDAGAYTATFAVAADIQKKFSARFLELYFAPWNDPALLIDEKGINRFISNTIKRYRRAPGWTDYRQPVSLTWVESVIRNMNWGKQPSHYLPAMNIRDTNLRLLPTHESSFTNWVSAGEGYPFDNLQVSYIPAYTPLTFLHSSRDGAWHLIMSRYGGGWIPAANMVELTFEQTEHWQQQEFIVATDERAEITTPEGRYITGPRLGVLYPLLEQDDDSYTIATYTVDHLHKPRLLPARLKRQEATSFPMPANYENMVTVMNNVLGIPYGWGGNLGFRDCSSINQDYFSTFGLWIPRHSSMQMQSGTPLSLEGISNKQKQKVIVEKGIPFLSFIGLPGHMMLYIGTYNEQAYAMHTLWGLKTFEPDGTEGRYVVGRTVITPLAFGDRQRRVHQSLLTRVTGMTNLVAPESVSHSGDTILNY